MLFDKPDPVNQKLPVQSPYMRTRSLMVPFIAILFLAPVFASGCIIHDPGRGHGHYAGPVAVQPRVAVAVPAPITFTFTDHHRHTVQDYYHHHPRHHGKNIKRITNGNTGEMTTEMIICRPVWLDGTFCLRESKCRPYMAT